MFRKYIRELVREAILAETHRLESYYEMSREARSLAIQALAKAETLDVTKSFLWRQAEATKDDEPEIVTRPKDPKAEFLEGLDEANIQNMAIDDDF